MATSPAQPSPANGHKLPRKSRAVVREIQTGSSVTCMHCGELVKWQAKGRQPQVVCNVYFRKKWHHIEHYHAACYELAGEPYGEADKSAPKATLLRRGQQPNP